MRLYGHVIVLGLLSVRQERALARYHVLWQHVAGMGLFRRLEDMLIVDN